MLLLEHCGMYFNPIMKRFTEVEEFLCMPQLEWGKLTKEQKLNTLDDFFMQAETCMILGATFVERTRLEELYGPSEGWFVSAIYVDAFTKEMTKLPVRSNLRGCI